MPMSWSGSRADIMEERLSLISYFKNHEDYIISKWAIETEKEFMELIHFEREREEKEESYYYGSFE
jgi:hypothetical protein